jgi:hypothetical protein
MYLENINYNLGKTGSKICGFFEGNLGRLPNKVEDLLLDKMKEMNTEVKDFPSFFKYFNLPVKSNE